MANRSRRNLYPKLRAGFENSWTYLKETKIIGGPLDLIHRLSFRVKASEEEDQLRVGNLLSVRDPDQRTHIIYPYFSKDTALGLRHARIGVGVLTDGFRSANPHTVAITDVVRGNIFLDSDFDIDGSEKQGLLERYDAVMREWRAQKRLMGRR